MTKIKLVDGTIINAETVELDGGVLKIATTEKTVEELHKIFSSKENTSLIVLMTESGIESGYNTGFTSLMGINYVDGLKTIELIQPVDATDYRIANAEGAANKASAATEELASEITDTQLALAELAEIVSGGAE